MDQNMKAALKSDRIILRSFDDPAATSQRALRHAGEVIPRLWVGDIRSVSYIEDLVTISTRNCHRSIEVQEKPKHTVTVTVISVMSSVKLLKYVSDLLEQKQEQLMNDQQLLHNEPHQMGEDATSTEQNAASNDTTTNDGTIAKEMFDTQSKTVNTDFESIKIHHMKVMLRDSMDADLMSTLKETSAFIDEALGCSLKTAQINNSDITNDDFRICLVHCAKGASRSVSVVIGYLLCRHPNEFSDFNKALEHVRKVRQHAMPNARFSADLCKYSEELYNREHNISVS
jgi:hypothetical protein